MDNVTFLDKTLSQVLIIQDDYTLIWTGRYDQHGDFTLEIPISYAQNSNIKLGYFIVIPDSELVMVIESYNPIEDTEQGDKLVLKGRSADVLLMRRVVSTVSSVDGSVQSFLIGLLNTHCISPTNTKRKIPYLVTLYNNDINSTIQNQYKPDEVYSIVENACVACNLGFKIILGYGSSLVFTLYSGEDRSYGQNTNPFVVFSSDNGNISNTSYFATIEAWKNFVYVLSDDEEPSLQIVGVHNLPNEPEGLDRLETLHSTSPVSRNVGDIILTETEIEDILSARGIPETQETLDTISTDIGDEMLTDVDVLNILYQKGIDDLSGKVPSGVYDGEVLSNVFGSVYGVDFFMGDIVQVQTVTGGTPARVVEHTISKSPTETSSVVSFDFEI